MGTDLITTTKLLCRFRYEELCFRPMARDNTLEKPEEADGSGEKKNARPQRELSDAALFLPLSSNAQKKDITVVRNFKQGETINAAFKVVTAAAQPPKHFTSGSIIPAAEKLPAWK